MPAAAATRRAAAWPEAAQGTLPSGTVLGFTRVKFAALRSKAPQRWGNDFVSFGKRAPSLKEVYELFAKVREKGTASDSGGDSFFESAADIPDSPRRESSSR